MLCKRIVEIFVQDCVIFVPLMYSYSQEGQPTFCASETFLGSERLVEVN